MCLIIKSDNASELKQNLLTSAYHNNSDGINVCRDYKFKNRIEAPE